MTGTKGNIRAILFDKDGTLFDFQNTWAPWARTGLARLCGDDAENLERAAQAIAFDLQAGRFRPESVVIAGTSREVGDVLSAALGRSAGEIVPILDSVASDVQLAPVKGVRDTLRHLSQSYSLGVVTNDAEATARVHVQSLDAIELFGMVIGYDSGFGFKPDPSPLLALCEHLSALPRESVMVGDSRHDLEAGRRAGLITVGVLTGVASAEDLSDLADVILPDVTHLPAWLDGIS